MNVLISLHRGYGLGDGVQMSAVLRHVAKYRPGWRVDYQAEKGKEVVGRGLVKNVFAYGDPQPTPHYDAEVQICLYDTWANFHDRPNTRVSSCLRERFGLEWDRECGRYRVNVRPGVLTKVRNAALPKVGNRVVAVHYTGDSSPDKKNLTHAQAISTCRTIQHLGRVPLLLDWRNTSPVPSMCAVSTVGRLAEAAQWGGDAEVNCAIISQCAAFVGIDSGPSKCASATDTPSLVVWTGHSPIPFHDPAENTTHLVPTGYTGCYPVVEDPQVRTWFEANHHIRWYEGDPVKEIGTWLAETLR